MELNPKAEHKEQALKVLKVCDANKTNEIDLTYDERNPFVVCTYVFPHTVLLPRLSSPFLRHHKCPPPPPHPIAAPSLSAASDVVCTARMS